MLSIVLLLVIVFVAFRLAPREKSDHAQIHGAGQIGLLAALALFGVDYFTSFYYATGEMMSALHPYGLQHYGYLAAGIIALANLVFGGLYMYSLGIFNEGGGSYTASMRYLWPTLSLIVAVTLIQDYVFTIVVSALSGVEQLLSVLNAYNAHWLIHFALGALLAAATWYITIRGRGDSGRVTFALLSIFVALSLVMAGGLLAAHLRGVAPVPASEAPQQVSIAQAMMHLLTASMKGMVALTGLEAMSNGIQFLIDEDVRLVRWGKRRLPRLAGLWRFYSGKSGIGRFVQTSFLFYGGITTFVVTFFAIRFNVFDGTLGRTLIGNLAFIGFSQLPGGTALFWFYQILAVALLAAASMTAFQDVQATEWRDSAIGEIPEVIVYRDKHGTFTRSVTITFAVAVLLMLLVHGQSSLAMPYYGIGVFMPIMVMGLAVRKHIQLHATGAQRAWGVAGATTAAILAGTVFVGQVAGKWAEGGWVVLISFSVLALAAHLILLSPVGHRTPGQIQRIVRQKARVQGGMASIVEWQSFKMQEYRYRLLLGLSGFLELFGIGAASAQQLALVPARIDEGVLDRIQPVRHGPSRMPEPWPESGVVPGRVLKPATAAAGPAPATVMLAEPLNGSGNGHASAGNGRFHLRIGRASFGNSPVRQDGSPDLDRPAAQAPAGVATLPERDPGQPYGIPPMIVRHRVIVPINGIHQGTMTALAYALALTSDVTAVHVAMDPDTAARLRKEWDVWGQGVRLVVLDSPHQMVLEPLIQYVQGILARRQPRETVTIVVPQMAQPRWWRNLWKSQLATLLRIALPVETGIVITDVPYEIL
jgi:hypothetical protein